MYGMPPTPQARFPQPGKGHPIDAEGQVWSLTMTAEASSTPHEGRVQVASEDGRLKRHRGSCVPARNGLIPPSHGDHADHRGTHGHHAGVGRGLLEHGGGWAGAGAAARRRQTPRPPEDSPVPIGQHALSDSSE